MKKIYIWLSQTLEFIIDLRIMIEKEYFNFSQQKQKLFYLLSYLQTLSLFLSSLQKSAYKCKIIDLQTSISQITRPFEYFQVESEVKLYLFLIPLTVYTIIILNTILIKRNYNLRKMKILKFLQNSQSIIKNLMITQILLIMAFQQLLFIFFFELSLISFYKSQSDIRHLHIGVFSLITSIITLGIQIMIIKFDNPVLFQLNLGKFHKSNTDYLQTILFTLIIITNRQQLLNEIQITGILLILIYIIKLKDIYLNFDKYYELQKFELILLSYCVCLVLIMTMADYQSNSQQDFEVFIVIYVASCPIVAQLLIHIIESIFINIFKTQDSIKQQNYKLQLINKCVYENKEDMNNFNLIILYININHLRGNEDQKFKYQQLLYCWLVQENDIFYSLIVQQRDLSQKLLYYLQFLKINFTRQVYEIQLQSKLSEIRQLLDKPKKIQLIDSTSTDMIRKTQNSFTNKVINFNKIGFHENLKLQIMKQSTKNQFLQTNNSEQDDMEQVIKLFLQFEENNKFILENIQLAINQKLQFLSNNIKRNTSVFQAAHEIVENLYEIEQKLISQYQQFPSKKMQNYIIFYFAEIQNDFLSAFKYQNVNTMTDENLIKMSINKSYDILKDNIEYVTVGLDDMTYKFDILSYSKGLINLIVKKGQQKVQLRLDDILPFGLPIVHVEYIERFLIHGKSKYFRQFSQAFFISNEKLLVQIDAVVDFLENTSKTSYVVFLKPLAINTPHIWVDQNHNISGITKDLIDLFTVSDYYQQKFVDNINFKPIRYLIPKFQALLDNSKNLTISTLQTELNISPFLSGVKGIKHNKFICDMIINVRNSPSGIFQYYIIQIYNCKTDGYEIIKQDDSIINEEPIFYGSILEQYNKKLILNGFQLFETQLNSPKSENLLMQEQIIDTQRDINLVSQENPQLETQYCQRLNHQIPHSEKLISSQKTVPQVEESRGQMMQGLAIQSQASSIAGIRSTKYFKRYELIHKFTTSDQPQQETKVQFILFCLILIVGGIYSAFCINLVNNDIQTVLQNIDVLTIKTTFAGAQDSYIICINAVIYHSIQQIYQIISQEEYDTQVQYSATRLNKIFDQLQINYKSIIENPSLSQYLVDKKMTINQKYGTSVRGRETSIHEAFVLYIESSYGYQTLKLDVSQMDLQASFIVFQLSNYQIFQAKIEEINQAMTELSIQKSQIFHENLHVLFFPCILISFILLSISFRYHLLTLRKFEKLNQNLQNDFGLYFKLEIERIKLASQFLNYEEQNYLYYHFDIFENENKLNQLEEELQQNTTHKSNKNNNPQFDKKPFIFKYLIFSIIFFLLHSSFQLTNYLEFLVYIRKLPLTIQYYDSIQSLQTSSSSLYISRQFSSQISVGLWSFFNDTQKQIALKSYNNSVADLKDFMSTQGNVNYNQLLLSQQYIDEYQRFMSTDLCEQIEYKQLISWFCDSYVGGSLRRGYSTAISAILFDFQSQYQEQDEFSQYIVIHQSELEGGLILGTVIGNLWEIIIGDMKQLTKSLSYQIIIISTIYLAIYLPICLLILHQMQKNLDEYFKIALRVVTLLPQSYLFLDNQIDRELRQMAIQFEL